MSALSSISMVIDATACIRFEYYQYVIGIFNVTALASISCNSLFTSNPFNSIYCWNAKPFIAIVLVQAKYRNAMKSNANVNLQIEFAEQAPS